MNGIYNTEVAESYVKSRGTHPIRTITYSRWLEELGDLSEQTVLDLACGAGHTSRMLIEECGAKQVIGVDISEPMLQKAKAIENENSLGIDYILGNAALVQFNCRFKTVCPTFLLNYAKTLQELEAMIKNIAHHTEPGGRMIALNASEDPCVPQLPNHSHWTEWVCPERAYCEGEAIRLNDVDVDGKIVSSFEFIYWSKETYERLLQEYGFYDIRWLKRVFPDWLRDKYENWEELEASNTSAVIAATKSS